MQAAICIPICIMLYKHYSGLLSLACGLWSKYVTTNEAECCLDVVIKQVNMNRLTHGQMLNLGLYVTLLLRSLSFLCLFLYLLVSMLFCAPYIF